MQRSLKANKLVALAYFDGIGLEMFDFSFRRDWKC